MSYIFQCHLKNLLHTFGKVPARELKRKGGGKIGRQIEKRVADWQSPPVRHSSDASISSHTTAETGALFPLDPSLSSRTFRGPPSQHSASSCSSHPEMATMENVIVLVNRIQRACTVLGDHGGGDGAASLPTLWEALPSVAVVGGQVCLFLSLLGSRF